MKVSKPVKSKQQILFYLLGCNALFMGLLINTSKIVIAQITPDNTLGAESSTINHGALKDIINGGATRGTNLFHSFQEFNVDAGKSVYFVNPTGIENILTRVTGGNVSNILGKLGVEGTANLFLINPNGIYFGAGASLDIRGSFTATTADSIKLGENGLFSATNPQSSNLLSVQPGVLFVNALKNQQAVIKNEGNLKVDDGQNLTLFGANVINTSILTAPGGIVQLTGAEKLKVRENIDTGTLLLDTKNITIGEDDNATINKTTLEGLSGNTNLIFQATNDITINPLSNNSLNFSHGSGNITFTADVDENDTGNFQMNIADIIKTNSRDINISGANLKLGNIDTSFVQENDIVANTINSGNINLTSNNGAIFLNNVFVINNNYGRNKGGDINITGRSLFVTNHSTISTNTYNQGNAGTVKIIATDAVKFDGQSKAVSQVETGATVNADAGKGGVEIYTQSLEMLGGSELNANTRGQGDAGTVKIIATDTVKFDGQSKALSQVEIGAIGNAGGVEISAQSLELLGGSILSASTSGQGDASSVKITATDFVKFNSQSKAFSEVQTGGKGNAQDVEISTQSLEMLGGSELNTNTKGQGDAGTVKIIATDTVKFDDQSKALSQVEIGAIGNAGGVEISAQSLELLGGSVLNASTSGQGDAGSVKVISNTFTANNGGKLLTTTSGSAKAGNITIKVKDNITLDGTQTGLFANTEPGSTGSGGDIDIDPETFIIRNGAGIEVNSEGTGQGGNISIQADTLTLDNNALINAATASNQGGEITLNINNLLWLRHNSKITASAGTIGGGGNGGNINITTPFIVGFASENNDITANAYQGDGGNINITANQIFGLQYRSQQTEFSDITASSKFGVSGNVEITTPGIDPTSGLINLPTNLVDVESLNKDVCAIKNDKIAGGNSFIITGKGGLPADTHESISNSPAFVEWEKISPNLTQVSNSPVKVTQKNTNYHPQIQQAQGWMITSDGKVILTADTQKITLQTDKNNLPNCK